MGETRPGVRDEVKEQLEIVDIQRAGARMRGVGEGLQVRRLLVQRNCTIINSRLCSGPMGMG